MFISKSNAKQIVDEMSSIIHRQINMMDENGIIIASTDEKRENQFHECARTIISQNLDEMLIEHDNEYEGTKEGINLPILLNGNIEGVIGITGKCAEVAKYGQIIKKMTEILLLDAYNKDQELTNEKMKAEFIKHWLFSAHAGITQDLISRGKAFGIDVAQGYRVLIASITDYGDHPGAVNRQILFDRASGWVKNRVNAQNGGVFFKNGSLMVGFIAQMGDAPMLTLANEIKLNLETRYGVKVSVGLDSPEKEQHGVLTAYKNAEKAMKCSAASGGTVTFYRDLNVGMFIDEIPRTVKEEFVRRVFCNCSEKQIDAWAKLLTVFFEVNCSISLAAEKLFIHKNTLQYKLNKLYKTTGYNPRNVKDAALYFMAIRFHDDIGLDLPED